MKRVPPTAKYLTKGVEAAAPKVDQQQPKEWTLNDGDELVWRPRPAGVIAADSSGAGEAAVAEKGISIRVGN